MITQWKGLGHPEGTLRPEDFIVIKANWENKDKNLMDIADELEILPESLVFIDDNPAERGNSKSADGSECAGSGQRGNLHKYSRQVGFLRSNQSFRRRQKSAARCMLRMQSENSRAKRMRIMKTI